MKVAARITTDEKTIATGSFQQDERCREDNTNRRETESYEVVSG
jgi:hypothetical protein